MKQIHREENRQDAWRREMIQGADSRHWERRQWRENPDGI